MRSGSDSGGPSTRGPANALGKAACTSTLNPGSIRVVDRHQLEAWLHRYGRAWEGRDPSAAVELFAGDATYQETPFEEPMRGREAIRAYWSAVPESQSEIVFAWETLDAEGDRAIVHWWASYERLREGGRTRLDGIFVLEFDESGLCRLLREWWHADPAPAF